MSDNRTSDDSDPNLSPAQTVNQGEDEGSTEHHGRDDHLHDDQKAPTGGRHVEGDDDGKTKDLTKAGRNDFDPNVGAD